MMRASSRRSDTEVQAYRGVLPIHSFCPSSLLPRYKEAVVSVTGTTRELEQFGSSAPTYCANLLRQSTAPSVSVPEGHDAGQGCAARYVRCRRTLHNDGRRRSPHAANCAHIDTLPTSSARRRAGTDASASPRFSTRDKTCVTDCHCHGQAGRRAALHGCHWPLPYLLSSASFALRAPLHWNPSAAAHPVSFPFVRRLRNAPPTPERPWLRGTGATVPRRSPFPPGPGGWEAE